MFRIKGIPVILVDRVEVGKNPFGEPIYQETEITVENVLVVPGISEDIPDSLAIDRTKETYTLAIPKGDKHDWFDHIVKFFDKEWRVCTRPQGGIEELVPLDWNRKVVVERYG